MGLKISASTELTAVAMSPIDATIASLVWCILKFSRIF